MVYLLTHSRVISIDGSVFLEDPQAEAGARAGSLIIIDGSVLEDHQSEAGARAPVTEYSL